MPSNGVDIKSASAGPDAIVYEQFGSLHLFDPATGKQHAVEIHVTGDLPGCPPSFRQSRRSDSRTPTSLPRALAPSLKLMAKS